MTAGTMKAGTERARPSWERAAEFGALYVGAPLALAVALPPSALPPVLLGTTLLGAVLLARTPGFAWSALARGWRSLDWRHVALVAAVTAAATGALVALLAPGQALELPRSMPGLWLMILALYPLLSALPQELVFRELFFRRYAGLFPGRGGALAASALVFGLAHLMFWNWVAVPLSFAGGLVFAHGYLARGGFPMAVALHAVCGGIVFTSGLGTFFYHGAVGAP